MAGGWDLIAYRDRNADPVDIMTVSSSGWIQEYVPVLAERAGLGEPVTTGYTPTWGVNVYENGEIHVKKEKYR